MQNHVSEVPIRGSSRLNRVTPSILATLGTSQSFLITEVAPLQSIYIFGGKWSSNGHISGGPHQVQTPGETYSDYEVWRCEGSGRIDGSATTGGKKK